jgi:hypothetical protein
MDLPQGALEALKTHRKHQAEISLSPIHCFCRAALIASLLDPTPIFS